MPLKFSLEFIKDLIILLAANIAIWLFCYIGKKNTITRKKGIFLLGLFILYLYIAIQ